MSLCTIFMTVFIAFVTELLSKRARWHQQQRHKQTCDGPKRIEHVLFPPPIYRASGGTGSTPPLLGGGGGGGFPGGGGGGGTYPGGGGGIMLGCGV
jgi:hypothetical protein